MDSELRISKLKLSQSLMGVNLEVTPHQSDDKAMLSSAPIEIEAIDSVTVARGYAWDPEHMTEEERKSSLGGNIRKII